MIYSFDQCELDTERLELRRDGELQSVEPQVFRLLLHLIENREHVVSKDELMDSVWDGRIVSDATLSSRINAARRAVGDSGKEQSVIRTIPRRGFRFVSDLVLAEISDDSSRENPAVSQTIGYCSTNDGVQLAYALAGDGPPLVKVASWLNHLEFDWESPVFRDLFHEIASYRQLVRYDSRGAGLSDWDIENLSFEALVSDLDTVIDAIQLPSFALLGISQGAAIAIDYAVRNPERVTHLILWGGFARGRLKRGKNEDAAQSEAFKTIMRQGWGKEASTFRQMFASLYLPEANDEQVKWWTDLQRIATSPDNALGLREAIDDLDVSSQLSKVQTPTLILHSEREEVAPLSEARLMAAKIPNVKFVRLDSANHIVLHQEVAWRRALDEIREFLS
jgi:DNA-binding winged helix-turn-helix (wHTH) protein/alpha-beta hydrolase superfamily lysophospholipase